MFEALLPAALTLDIDFVRKSLQAMPTSGGNVVEIYGVVSTEHPDVQGDILDQASVDWNYFLQNGKIDWEHGKDPKDIIGYPTKIHKGLSYHGKPATGLTAHILKNVEKGAQAIELLKAWVDVPDATPMGFSVYGGGRRDPVDPRRLCKARFSRVALTGTPVNPFSVATIIKAMGQEVVPPLTSLTRSELHRLVEKAYGQRPGLDAFVEHLFKHAKALDGQRTRM